MTLIEFVRRLETLEKDYASMAIYWSIAKWVAGGLGVYIIGVGYKVWKWTRESEKRFEEKLNERADGLFQHFGGEKENTDGKLELLDRCNQENSRAVGLVLKEVEHERRMREQQMKDCKERCEAVRCNDK